MTARFWKLFKEDSERYYRKTWYIMYSQESMAARRDRLKSAGVVHQLEMMHCITRHPLVIPARNHKHYEGSTAGDCIAGVKMEDEQTQINTNTFFQKKTKM